ncbi:hypothetical protein HanOQP8_Chr10g0363331 [Helianthus annuus]|nr:hypothetical protein HanOQP8_Chr10g0363331 [Helianthus annuus]KAJ0883517.1 hypothetical protein HanPSC8_Chr10g0422471 [Helianthus annuus]
MKCGGGSFKQNVSATTGQDLVIRNESPRNAFRKSGNTPMESYVRPAVHTPPLFIPPQMLLLMSFGNNMMYPDLPSLPLYYFQGPPTPPESLRGMAPVVGPPIPPPMYFVADPMLYARIVSQIDYYFRYVALKSMFEVVLFRNISFLWYFKSFNS